MNAINKATILGRLGNDPQTTETQDGNTITRISVATSDTWKDKNTGEKREATEWHRVVFFGQISKIASQYLRKGSQVYIEGKLKTSKYTDKEGIERYSTDVICSGFDSKLIMLGGKGSQDSSDEGGYSQPQMESQNNQPTQKVPDEMKVDISDDLPF